MRMTPNQKRDRFFVPLLIRIFTKSAISVCIEELLPNARTGFPHSRPSPQSSAIISKCDDRRVPINWVESSPPASNSDLQPASRKIAWPERRACPRCRWCLLLPQFQSVYFVYLARFVRVRESFRLIHLFYRYWVFRNPRVGLRYGYQCGQAVGLKSVFDIWLPRRVHKCRVLVSRRGICRGRVTHNRPYFSCLATGKSLTLRIFFRNQYPLYDWVIWKTRLS